MFNSYLSSVKKLSIVLTVFLISFCLTLHSNSIAEAVDTQPDIKALAYQLVKDKGWDTLPNADVIADSFVRIADSSRIFTPEQVLDDIKTRLKDIKMLSDDEWPYYSDGAMYLIPSQIKYAAIVHETTHALSSYNNTYNSSAFSPSKTVTVGSMRARSMMLEGLTDFFAYRSVPEYCETYKGFRDINESNTVYYIANICQNIGYPLEYGLVVPFMYAAGSIDVEKAYYIGEYGRQFKENFDKQNGIGKLDSLITNIDELTLYIGYNNIVCKTEQDKQTAIDKTKAYINALTTILENRFTRLTSMEQVKEFQYDLNMYKNYAVEITDKEFMDSVTSRIFMIEEKLAGYIENPGSIPTATVIPAQVSDPFVDSSTENIIKSRLSGALALYIGSPKVYANNISTFVDSTNTSVTPLVKNDRTLVPVRFISENCGADVKWDEITSTATITLGSKVVKISPGSMEMFIDGNGIILDVPAEISSGRLFIPIRKLVEDVLGKKVFYDRGLIIISDNENIFDSAAEQQLIDIVIKMLM